MSVTASQIFDIKAPQCATDSNKSTYIEIARTQTSECWFGDNYENAVGLRAAHMCLLDQSTASTGGGASGIFKSKKEGDLQIQYNTPTSGKFSNDDYLAQTNPGKELLNLSRTRGVSMGTIGMPLCSS